MAFSPQAQLPNLITILYLLLSQLSLAAALPTPHHLFELHTRAAPDLSSASGKIAGGVFALILISLLFGLGAATVAIKGSVEWREFRDRNKPLPPADEEKGTVIVVANMGGEKERPDTTDSEKTAVAAEVVVSEEEKEYPVTPTMSGASGEEEEEKVQFPPRTASPTPSGRSARRLTLKSFLPVDFAELTVGWLKETNAK